MKGTTLIYRPGEAAPEAQTHTESPSLEFLQAVVGGYIEAVPDWGTIEIDGKVFPCVVYCNEEGKLTEGMLVNHRATILWDQALRRVVHDGKPAYPNGLLRADGNPIDMLLGPIIVVTGDPEFMRSL